MNDDIDKDDKDEKDGCLINPNLQCSVLTMQTKPKCSEVYNCEPTVAIRGAIEALYPH